MHFLTKQNIFLTAAVSLALSASAFAAPAAPTGLQAPELSVGTDGMTLIWERPAKTDDIISYNIYMDNRLIAQTNHDFSSQAKKEIHDFYIKSPQAQKATDHIYRVRGLLPGSRHTFMVRALDKNGEESAASNTLTRAAAVPTKVVNIKQYGAIGDGRTINTAAIQKAIRECPAGGTVIIPAGIYKSGALWLKSNMTLEIQKDAILLASESADAYPYHYKLYPYLSDERYYGFINAKPGPDGKQLQNIRIVGEGTIDGNGWKKDGNGDYLYREKGKNKDGTLKKNHVLNIGILAANQVRSLEENQKLSEDKAYPRRTSLILLQGVDHVYLSSLTLRNPANHTFIAQHCNDVVVENTQFRTFNCNNGDGIEFGHGSGLKVMDSVFDTGDDCVNFAAGQGALGAKDHPTEKIWIFNNSFHHGHGAVVMGSHTAAYIQKLLAEDNVMDGTDIALRMKTNPVNGGGARDIVFRNNAARNMVQNFFIATTAYSDPNAAADFPKAEKSGSFYNILVQDCTVEKTGKAAIEIEGREDAMHHNITFRNIKIGDGQPWRITNAKNISFDNITQTTTKEKTVGKEGKKPIKSTAKALK